jgi:mycofactocin system creatininase family protein
VTELARLAWTDVAAVASRAVLLVPVGATEQHGPHLPLGTDTTIATALAVRAADEVERGPSRRYRHLAVLVAPAIPVGSSGEHEDFPGTLSIGQEATELVLVEIVRSACRHLAAVVLVSCHGGNHEPVTRAVDRLRAEGRQVTAWSPRWRGDAHAGQTETSVVAALDPGLVTADRAVAGETAPLATLLPRLRSEGVRAVSPNGVLGDPTGADAAAGRELLDAAVADLAEHVRGLLTPRDGAEPGSTAPGSTAGGHRGHDPGRREVGT